MTTPTTDQTTTGPNIPPSLREGGVIDQRLRETGVDLTAFGADTGRKISMDVPLGSQGCASMYPLRFFTTDRMKYRPSPRP